MMEERTNLVNDVMKAQFDELMDKRDHIKNAIHLINFYYPEGVTDDLERCPDYVREYIRDVMNARGKYCYRPELEEDDKDYWNEDNGDENLYQQIIDDYINGLSIHDLTVRHNWPQSRIRKLLRNEQVYIRNRYLFILEPKTVDKPMLMFDTLKEVCEVLKISPSTINDFVDTIYKNWYITRRDLVKELYIQNEAKRRYEQKRQF